MIPKLNNIEDANLEAIFRFEKYIGNVHWLGIEELAREEIHFEKKKHSITMDDINERMKMMSRDITGDPYQAVSDTSSLDFGTVSWRSGIVIISHESGRVKVHAPLFKSLLSAFYSKGDKLFLPKKSYRPIVITRSDLSFKALMGVIYPLD